MARRERSRLKAGQHLIIRVHGNNGDLIVGVVKSARGGGADVICTNLLSGERSTKSESILLTRNVVVPKRLAMQVVQRYHEALDQGQSERAARQAARECAVNLAESVPARVRPERANPSSSSSGPVSKVLRMVQGLPVQYRQLIILELISLEFKEAVGSAEDVVSEPSGPRETYLERRLKRDDVPFLTPGDL